MRPEGLEPPAFWSVARRSIQLSYGRKQQEPCPRQDSNLYAVTGTGPSNQPVYQFQHVGGVHARGGTRTLTGSPPQDPESCASTNSATRARSFIHHDGAEGNRTPDLLNAIQALSQLSYGPLTRPAKPGPLGRLTPIFQTTPNRQTGLTGLEPATSGVTDRHSNQLSYSPKTSSNDAPTGNRTPVTTLKEWFLTVRRSGLRSLPLLTGPEGLEPPTAGFGDRCSTN